MKTLITMIAAVAISLGLMTPAHADDVQLRNTNCYGCTYSALEGSDLHSTATDPNAHVMFAVNNLPAQSVSVPGKRAWVLYMGSVVIETSPGSGRFMSENSTGGDGYLLSQIVGGISYVGYMVDGDARVSSVMINGTPYNFVPSVIENQVVTLYITPDPVALASDPTTSVTTNGTTTVVLQADAAQGATLPYTITATSKAGARTRVMDSGSLRASERHVWKHRFAKRTRIVVTVGGHVVKSYVVKGKRTHR